MSHAFFDRYTTLKTPVHMLDARIKIAVALILIVSTVSLPKYSFPVYAVYFAFIIAVTALARVPFGYLFKRSLVVAPFALAAAVFMPFTISGSGDAVFQAGPITAYHAGFMAFFNAVSKSYVGVLMVIALTAVTPFPKLLEGLERLRVPGMFVTLTGFTYRYLFVLIEEVKRMKRARDLRFYGGRWLWQAGTAGQMAGSLFLRSFERGERVYNAMLSRGFDGVFRGGSGRPLNGMDWSALIISTVFITGARMLLK
ncbi:MAG: cobalt ECF transporter T component CbiQ [Nitrospinae bacterium]|nr:cobalt ECF transporter T component CbiQ [Nitrospinota bacterium]